MQPILLEERRIRFPSAPEHDAIKIDKPHGFLPLRTDRRNGPVGFLLHRPQFPAADARLDGNVDKRNAQSPTLQGRKEFPEILHGLPRLGSLGGQIVVARIKYDRARRR